jgi:lysophospholipase L1-like esterase
MSSKFSWLGPVFVTLVLLELGAFGLQATNVVSFEAPSYSIKQVVPFWRDLDPAFGVWHPEEKSYRHVKSCFDVTYRSNAHGARDVERSLQSDKPRAVVLGDSFTEGYGLADDDRMTNMLEASTGREHLNFGTSGTFGPTQYWLLYQNLAKKFDHDMVVVMLLPDNDFADDDIELGKHNHSDRYRPYWVDDGDSFKLTYYQTEIDEKVSRNLVMKYVRGFLREFSYGYRALDYLFKLALHRRGSEGESAAVIEKAKKRGYAGYYDFTDRQWKVMAHNLRSLAEAAKGKQMVWVTIPRHGDFLRWQTGEAPKLSLRLQALASELNVGYLDMLPDMAAGKAWDELFLTCDDHWNAAGSRRAADLIQGSHAYQAWLAGTVAVTKTLKQ